MKGENGMPETDALFSTLIRVRRKLSNYKEVTANEPLWKLMGFSECPKQQRMVKLLINLVKEHIEDPTDRDLVLLAYGLLEGYSKHILSERRLIYLSIEHKDRYDKYIQQLESGKKDAKEVATNYVRAKEDRIIKELAKRIVEDVDTKRMAIFINDIDLEQTAAGDITHPLFEKPIYLPTYEKYIKQTKSPEQDGYTGNNQTEGPPPSVFHSETNDLDADFVSIQIESESKTQPLVPVDLTAALDIKIDDAISAVSDINAEQSYTRNANSQDRLVEILETQKGMLLDWFLSRSFAKELFVTPITIEQVKNIHQSLDVWVSKRNKKIDLTRDWGDFSDKEKSLLSADRVNQSEQTERWEDYFLSSNASNISILADPGFGKTWLLHYQALIETEAFLSDEHLFNLEPIPIYITCSNLAGEKGNLIDRVCSIVNPINPEGIPALSEHINTYGITLFLDSLDEVPNDNLSSLSGVLSQRNNANLKGRVILTSRHAQYDRSMVGISGWEEIELRPLTKPQCLAMVAIWSLNKEYEERISNELGRYLNEYDDELRFVTDLGRLFRVPLLLAVTCRHIKDQSDDFVWPENDAEIYKWLVEDLIRQPQKGEERLITLDPLTCDKVQILAAYIAYKMSNAEKDSWDNFISELDIYKYSNQLFPESGEARAIAEVFTKSGLVTARIESELSLRSYEFLHKGISECLVSLFIKGLVENVYCLEVNDWRETITNRIYFSLDWNRIAIISGCLINIDDLHDYMELFLNLIYDPLFIALSLAFSISENRVELYRDSRYKDILIDKSRASWDHILEEPDGYGIVPYFLRQEYTAHLYHAYEQGNDRAKDILLKGYICTPEFHATSYYYIDFEQFDDADIINIWKMRIDANTELNDASVTFLDTRPNIKTTLFEYIVSKNLDLSKTQQYSDILGLDYLVDYFLRLSDEKQKWRMLLFFKNTEEHRGWEIPWKALLSTTNYCNPNIIKLKLANSEKTSNTERLRRYQGSLRFTDEEVNTLAQSITNKEDLQDNILFRRATMDRDNEMIIANAISQRIELADLFEMLDNEDTMVFAASCLHYRDDAEKISPLLILSQNGNRDIRRCAARALGSCDDEQVISRLKEMTFDFDYVVVFEAARSLSSIYYVKTSSEKHDAVVNSEFFDSAQFAIGLRAYDVQDQEVNRIFMLLALTSGDEGIRAATSDKLLCCEEHYVMQSLLTAVENCSAPRDLEEHYYILRALATMPYAVANDLFIRIALLQNDNETTVHRKRRIANALVLRKDEDVLPVLIQYAQDSDPYIRWCMARALGNHKSEEAISFLFELLESEEVYIKCAAIDSLGKSKSASAISILSGLLSDHDFLVRISAILALANYNNVDVLAQLLDMSNDGEACVRATVARVLVKCRGSIERKDCTLYESYNATLAKLKSDSSALVKQSFESRLENTPALYRTAETPGYLQSKNILEGLLMKDDFVYRLLANSIDPDSKEKYIPVLLNYIEHIAGITDSAMLAGIAKILTTDNDILLVIANGILSTYQYDYEVIHNAMKAYCDNFDPLSVIMHDLLIYFFHKHEIIPSNIVGNIQNPEFILVLMAMTNHGDAAIEAMAWKGLATFVSLGYENYIREWIKPPLVARNYASFYPTLFEESPSLAIRFFEDFKHKWNENNENQGY